MSNDSARLALVIRRERDGTIIHRSHPHGWCIKQERREPISRVGRMHGQADHPGAMTWWEVRRFGMLDRQYMVFDTLREARAWCDQHKEWPR